MDYILDSKEVISYKNNNYHLRIRSCNINNPVVLFLHGGCGSPDRAHIMKYQSPLAEKYTLVCWDQRGSGYAYDKEEAKKIQLTKDIYISDAHNVLLYLKERFNQNKIIIAGHSFGSVLGVWLCIKYPADIAAYVGVGQCVDYLINEQYSYKKTLEEAERLNDKKAIKDLRKIGFPINGKYSQDNKINNKCILVQRSYLHKYGGAVYSKRKPYWQELLFDELPVIRREYNLRGIINYVKGIGYCLNSPVASTNPDFLNTATVLQVPVYLLLGHHDLNCAWSLAEEWFNQLQAPNKELIWFENSAHSPQWEEPNLWNKRFAEIFMSANL